MEAAVASMREGEAATVTVQPEGGYGAAGSPSEPRVRHPRAETGGCSGDAWQDL